MPENCKPAGLAPRRAILRLFPLAFAFSACAAPPPPAAPPAAPSVAALAVVASVTHRTTPAREPMVVRHPSGNLFLAGFGRPEHGGAAVDPLVPRLWRSGDGGGTWESVDVGGLEDGAVGNSDVDLAVGPDGTLYFVALRFDPERRGRPSTVTYLS